MRKPPSATLPAITPANNQQYITQVRKYKLITPLFGGGVEPTAADPVSTLRATEVRGQLRFWWRACRAGQYATLTELKDAEDALWGAASTADRMRPSEVQVALNILNKGKPFLVLSDGQPISIGHQRSPYSYAAFPLQDKPEAVTVEGVEFELAITYPAKEENEIQAALWAWETFGGLGGRTRRGFGALALVAVNGKAVMLPPSAGLAKEIETKLALHMSGTYQHKDLPMLSMRPRMRLLRQDGDPLVVWRTLLNKYKAFRQARNGRFGRSLWPEPDAIRRRTRSASKHSSPMSGVDKFPRAQFGLPIVFHFKDAGDPPDTILQGVKAERLASPMILKPVACSGNRAVGMAFVLNAPRFLPDGLELKGAERGSQPRASVKEEASDIRPLNGRADVLQAFLDDLETL
jgi:CRISPR-associated protein Cmr1